MMSPRNGRLMYNENPFIFSDCGVRYEVQWVKLNRSCYGVEAVKADGIVAERDSKEWRLGVDGWALLNSGY